MNNRLIFLKPEEIFIEYRIQQNIECRFLIFNINIKYRNFVEK